MNAVLPSRAILAQLAYLGVFSSALFALNPQKTLAEYTRTVWTQSQGLPQDSVRSIAQTTDGCLWISTNEGLSRFDGYDFTTFTKEDGSLPSNSVGVIAAGRDGVLWIATPEGLTLYRNGTFTTFTQQNGLPDNHIAALLEEHNGALWIIAGAWLSRFEQGKFTNFPADRLPGLAEPRSLYEDSRKTLWISGTGGLVKLVDGTFIPVLGIREMDGQSGITMTGDRRGGLWIGGTKGIILRKPDGTLRRFDSRDGLSDNVVLALWSDRDDNLWAGTNRGLSRLEGDRFVAPDFGSGTNRDFIRCLFEDQEGDLWAGTRSGLNRFRDDAFTVFDRSEGFPGDTPVAVHQDRSGTIWVGYNGSGLVALRNGRIQHYETKDGLASNTVFAIREARNGDLLIPSRAGLSRMHGGSFTNYTLPDSLGRTVALDALEDDQGRIWVAGQAGLYESTGNEFRNIIPTRSPLNAAPVALASGLDGTVWVGSNGGGLLQIRNGKRHWFTVANGLGSDAVRTLYQDPDGTLWIGSLGGGLNAFRNGSILKYTVKDGLLSNNISHIEDDGQGFLWLSTHRGICRVSKQQLQDFSAGRVRILTPINYDVEDGLPSSQVAPGYPTGGGGTRTVDGRLWFPTTKGLAVIGPEVERARPLPAPALEFMDITVDGKSLEIAHMAKLSPGLRHIQFRYAAVYLKNPEIVRYEYKLAGFDSDWIPAGNSRTVNYTSLRYGRYRFLVRAFVPRHAPSEGSFDMEVLPYFYERSDFIWLSLTAFLAAIYAIYRFSLHQMRVRFSLVLDERARMAREIHDTLSQGFVGISSQLNAVAGRIRANDGVAEQHLDLARKMARHSLTEARRALMDLRVPLLDKLDLFSALSAAVEQWIGGSEIQVEVIVSGDRRQFPQEVSQNVLRIAQEAVTNGRKHAGANKIQIQLKGEPQELTLIVKDDGCGFDPAKVSMAEGHFGLMGMRERAERLGGEFDFFSEPSVGTRITVSIPLPPERPNRAEWRNLLGFLRRRLHQAHS